MRPAPPQPARPDDTGAQHIPAWLPAWQLTDVSSPERRVNFAPMTEADLDDVCEVEKQAYAHPWSRQHFADSVAAGYPAVLLVGQALPGELAHPLRADDRVLLGYLVAMPGVEEVHLLNITVPTAHQRCGWARIMLDALVLWSRNRNAHTLWLEVRTGNRPACALYKAYGFCEVGVRKAYYPAAHGRREDALVMSLALSTATIAGVAA